MDASLWAYRCVWQGLYVCLSKLTGEYESTDVSQWAYKCVSVNLKVSMSLQMPQWAYRCAWQGLQCMTESELCLTVPTGVYDRISRCAQQYLQVCMTGV